MIAQWGNKYMVLSVLSVALVQFLADHILTHADTFWHADMLTPHNLWTWGGRPKSNHGQTMAEKNQQTWAFFGFLLVRWPHQKNPLTQAPLPHPSFSPAPSSICLTFHFPSPFTSYLLRPTSPWIICSTFQLHRPTASVSLFFKQIFYLLFIITQFR